VGVALVIQHVKRMRLILSSVAKSGSTIFFHIIAQVKCVSIFSKILSETFLILRKIQLDSVINVHTPSR